MNQATIRSVVESENCPYASLIERAVVSEFPNVIVTPGPYLLDSLTEALLATGQIRFGPRPSPEAIVAIRKTIQASIDNKIAIPVLSPWGSQKPNTRKSIDVAEVSGLKTLACLQSRVRELYAPGLDIRIRVEDVGGLYLFNDKGADGVRANRRYVSDLFALWRVLSLDEYVTLVAESTLMSDQDYNATAHKFIPIFLDYIMDTDANGVENYESRESYQALRQAGWSGSIPKEMRDFYRGRYAKFYGSDMSDATYRLAKYLAGSLARYLLHGTGADPDWEDGYVQVSLASPVPGDPRRNVIHYRTIPMCFTRDNIPPWRAHGYFRVHEDGTVTPALASAWNEETSIPHGIILTKDDETVRLQTDYRIEEES